MNRTNRKKSTHIDDNTQTVCQKTSSYRPKTPLGRKLWKIRAKIIASGEPLLDWDDIEREVAERRGGIESRIK